LVKHSAGRSLYSSEDVGVADDADAVAGTGLGGAVDGDAPLGFVAEGLGVVGEVVALPEECAARTRGRRSRLLVFEQTLEAAAVVSVAVREAERRQVLVAVALGQRGDELVDHRRRFGSSPASVAVVDVDLDERLGVDDDRRRIAVCRPARTRSPSQESPSGPPRHPSG
jgi:hypothetical protein